MSNLTIFNYESKEVRTVMVDGEPWFVAKDVCDLLDVFWNGEDTLIKIPSEWKGVVKLHTPGGNQSVWALNESAVYKLAFRSNKKEADDFTNKVATYIKRLRNKELIPGNFAEALQLAADQARQLERQTKQITQDKPYTELGKKVSKADDSILIRQFAKDLDPTGKVFGGGRLFGKLYKDKILIKHNEPFQVYLHWFDIVITVNDHGGKDVKDRTLYVNKRGQASIRRKYNHLLEEDNG